MDKHIWKFKLSTGENAIMMPKGSTILTAQMQNGNAHIWAICDNEADDELVNVLVTGTGHRLDTKKYKNYVATVQAGPFVFHVFTEQLNELQDQINAALLEILKCATNNQPEYRERVNTFNEERISEIISESERTTEPDSKQKQQPLDDRHGRRL